MKKDKTSSGSKAHQRSDTERRIQPYSEWHRSLDRSLYATDVDFIEWRYQGDELTAVGVMEVTRVDMKKTVDRQYLDAIIQRINNRDFQATAAQTVASALGTSVYIVLFREDCSEFWVYNLSEGNGWFGSWGPDRMEEFLQTL